MENEINLEREKHKTEVEKLKSIILELNPQYEFIQHGEQTDINEMLNILSEIKGVDSKECEFLSCTSECKMLEEIINRLDYNVSCPLLSQGGRIELTTSITSTLSSQSDKSLKEEGESHSSLVEDPAAVEAVELMRKKIELERWQHAEEIQYLQEVVSDLTNQKQCKDQNEKKCDQVIDLVNEATTLENCQE